MRQAVRGLEDTLTEEQQRIVDEYKEIFETNLTQEEKKERYNLFLNEFIAASPMYTFPIGADGRRG